MFETLRSSYNCQSPILSMSKRLQCPGSYKRHSQTLLIKTSLRQKWTMFHYDIHIMLLFTVGLQKLSSWLQIVAHQKTLNISDWRQAARLTRLLKISDAILMGTLCSWASTLQSYILMKQPIKHKWFSQLTDSVLIGDPRSVTSCWKMKIKTFADLSHNIQVFKVIPKVLANL